MENNSFENRKKKSDFLLSKYSDKIPMILEKSSKEKYLPKIEKTKYLVPHDLTVAGVMQILKKNLKIDEHISVYLSIYNQNIILSGSQSISDIYSKYKNNDGFIYLEYCSENVFG
jgi:hypothetical protein